MYCDTGAGVCLHCVRKLGKASRFGGCSGADGSSVFRTGQWQTICVRACVCVWCSRLCVCVSLHCCSVLVCVQRPHLCSFYVTEVRTRPVLHLMLAAARSSGENKSLQSSHNIHHGCCRWQRQVHLREEVISGLNRKLPCRKKLKNTESVPFVVSDMKNCQPEDLI